MRAVLHCSKRHNTNVTDRKIPLVVSTGRADIIPQSTANLAEQGNTYPNMLEREAFDWIRAGRWARLLRVVIVVTAKHEKLVAFSCERKVSCSLAVEQDDMAESPRLLVDDVLQVIQSPMCAKALPMSLRYF